MQMWASRWALIAATDQSSASVDDVEDVTELQTGDTADYGLLIKEVQSGDNSGLFAIDDYLKAHVVISALS